MSKNIQNFTKVISYPPENHSKTDNKYIAYKLPYMAFFNRDLCMNQKKYSRTISHDIYLNGLLKPKTPFISALGYSTRYPKFRMELVLENSYRAFSPHYIEILPD